MTGKIQNSHYFLTHNENTLHRAGVAKLADALDLGSSGATRESSSLSSRTRCISTFQKLVREWRNWQTRWI